MELPSEEALGANRESDRTPSAGGEASRSSNTPKSSRAIDILLALLKEKVEEDPKDQLQILVAFDEVHSLTEDKPSYADKKYRLDYLTQAMSYYVERPIFFILMSTISDRRLLAPAGLESRSQRYSNIALQLHAPITETPFTCIKDGSIKLSTLPLSALSDFVFMALFGRPLCVSPFAPDPTVAETEVFL